MKKISTEWWGDLREDRFMDENGSVIVQQRQDITKLLNDNKAKRNATSSWRKFDPKQEMHQLLDLSMTDVMRLKTEHNIDLFGEVDWDYVFKVIETYYPYMKTTTARLR